MSATFRLRAGARPAAIALALLFAGAAALAQEAQPAVAAAAAATTTHTTGNPYGIQALWDGSDVVAKGTLLILAVMSLGSWYIILGKLLEQARIKRFARESTQLWKAERVDAQHIARLKDKSPFRYIAETGLGSVGKHSAVGRHITFNDWLALSIQQPIDVVQNRLQGGLAFLATVGSTAPFVGLFGTVWGIYHALTAIGLSGQASIDKVAGPVGEALIMTAIGLAVAVPAVLGYNWLVRRNKVALDDIRNFGSSLHSALLATPVPAH
ncbi:MotA/TolQ/ExbB proton channel family protein [Xylophilus sp.]|uniref:MotA/TolQ/ExbB proton channel family protein n=1 Tax=Xylophilus sp. TaxID=2653893 RepID=UPI0013B9ACD0|nr:MotA/TolQ/ExbB proton channel family protein [Xylophilus sp.]KAF1047664.1 MAG: Protein TolQ [Xylophilus sp.]